MYIFFLNFFLTQKSLRLNVIGILSVIIIIIIAFTVQINVNILTILVT